MARLYGGGEKPRLVVLANRCMARSYWAFAITTSGLLIFGNAALTIISPGHYHLDVVLLSLLIVAIFFERVAGMNFQLAHLTNRIYSHIGAVGTTSLSLTVALLFGPIWGIRAFALGLLIGQIGFQSWYAMWSAGKLLKFDAWRFNFRCAAMPLGLLATAISVVWANQWLGI
jgi:hypothetical protein